MYQQQVNVINSFRMITDAIAIILAGLGAYHILLYVVGGAWILSPTDLWGSILCIMFLNNYIFGRFGMYDDHTHPGEWDTVKGIIESLFVSFSILCIGLAALSDLHRCRDFLVYFGILSILFLLVSRRLTGIWHARSVNNGFRRRQILIVGHDDRTHEIGRTLATQLSWGHEVIGYLSMETHNTDCLGTISDLPEILVNRSVDEVIFALEPRSGFKLDEYLKLCRSMGVAVKIVPSLWEPNQTYVNVEKCQGVPMLTYYQNSFSASGLLYKRILDIAGGIIGTLIFLILYPFVAAAIKLDSPGPVLFKQKRAGMNGRVFNLLKFRTMYQDAEVRKKELVAQNEMTGAMFKIENDPRITKVGHFLRRTSLDEFPQFINVLRGEMSLVGTRPPTLDEVAEYERPQHRRISAKPGITGLWQISGRNSITDFDEIVRLDCEYIDNWRFLDDIRIIFKTIKVVFTRKGAL